MGGNILFKVNTFVRFSIALALILVNIYLLSRVSFIFQPLVTMITVITVPMMLSVFFYYLLRPLVNYMEKKKINRTLSILLIYLVIAILGVFFIIGLWPSLREQLFNLVDNAPSLINSLSDQLRELEQNGAIQALFPEGSTPFSQITEYINKGFNFVTNYVSGFFSLVSSFAIILFTLPILLFYMLLQGEKFGRKLAHIAPKRFQNDSREVVIEIDQALSGFIVGRVLVESGAGCTDVYRFLDHWTAVRITAHGNCGHHELCSVYRSDCVVRTYCDHGSRGITISCHLVSDYYSCRSADSGQPGCTVRIRQKAGYSPAHDHHSGVGCRRPGWNYCHPDYYPGLYDR